MQIGVDKTENELLKVTDSADGENIELVVSRLLRADFVVAWGSFPRNWLRSWLRFSWMRGLGHITIGAFCNW